MPELKLTFAEEYLAAFTMDLLTRAQQIYLNGVALVDSQIGLSRLDGVVTS